MAKMFQDFVMANCELNH